jgi:Tfp pilus assembly protein PilF
VSSKFLLASLASLAVLAVLPYLNSLSNGFVFDDWQQVVHNPYIRNFQHLRQIFTTGVWSYRTGFAAVSNYYRPMMMLGYAVCYRFFGPSPFSFHLLSVVLNAAVVLLVYFLTLRLFSDRLVALAAATVFAVDPIHSEAVDWIAAITELEVAFFFVLTFLLYLLAGQATRRRGWILCGMGIAYVGALLSKEQAVMLPLVATAHEHLYREDRARTTPFQKAWRYGWLWLLAGGYIVARVAALKSFAPVEIRKSFGTVEIALAALALVGQYLWKTIWPVHLLAFYVFPNSVYALSSWMLAGLAGLTLSAFLFVVLYKIARPYSFGVIWFFATLLPVLNVHWMPENAFSERYLYLPSVGFCWIVGWATRRLWEASWTRGRAMRAVLTTAAAALIAASITEIVRRNPVWKDDQVFYRQTLRAAPAAYMFHNNLGTVYWQKGEVSEAEREWKITLKLRPRYAYALNNMGLVMQRKKQYARAASYFQRALRSQPDYPQAHLELGRAYLQMGLLKKAEPEIQSAVREDPTNSRAWDALGEVSLQQGSMTQARQQFQRSVALRPTVQAYCDLAVADVDQRNYARAEQALRQAQSLNPRSVQPRLMLGLLLARRGQKAGAASELQSALKLDPSNAQAQKALNDLIQPSPYAQSGRH